ncbi:glycine cleavage system aminomethyltransferase GcvT [Rhodococcus sp. X156]|uniref:glycine cleavage system aminomethyltransferase GcvT n=1 Tax=Rhodococcus sp. X156 TaxID=2499145 RepID=UPI000FD9ADF0|nr:glycine cleavage system aminomethyltransferase GcvT [Rhodococcus sp. X156]
MDQQSSQLRQSPVRDQHVALGATFAPFGGWEMPVSYAGVVAEHTSVREAVGVFDVSHLGKAAVRGPGAAELVNRCLTNDLGRISPGQAQYTLCCTPDGGVVDDLIAYLVSDDEVFLVPNAANTAAVCDALSAAAPAGVTVTDEHTGHGVLAVQGPRSAEVLAQLGLPQDMDYMAFADAQWQGRAVRVCRTGYTGEHGYELLPRWADTAELFAALLAAAEPLGGQPCGLGARDTLRTEMGYPLHGHELTADITPVQARAGWAVGWGKPEFWGKQALEAEKATGPVRRTWGLRASGRGVPRADMPVLVDGVLVGRTTSGTFSPTLRTGIALALLDTAAGLSPGSQVVVDVRGRSLPCEVVAPPFVPAHTR